MAKKWICSVCKKEVKKDFDAHADNHRIERRKTFENELAEYKVKLEKSRKDKKAKTPNLVQYPNMSVEFIHYNDKGEQDGKMLP